MKNALNTFAHKIADNKAVILKRGAIIAAAGAGIILAAFAVVKLTEETGLELPSVD